MELSKQEIARYKRHLLLEEVGAEGQLALNKARVLVIGAGGLGNAVLPYLAAAGVGNITIIDKDVVDVSNLQRQVMFNESDIGKPKAEVLVQRLKAQNSAGKFEFINDFYTINNAIELSVNQDVIIDCVDNINTRYLINDVAVHVGIPMVYGAIHKFEGQVSVFNFKNGATYRCAFPENASKLTPQNCEDAGVIGVLPGLVGMYQAMEVIKIIIGAGKVLTNKIMMIDLLNNTNHKIEIERKQESVRTASQRIEELGLKITEIEIIDIYANDILDLVTQNPEIIIIDIQHQTEVKSLAGIEITHIPVHELEQNAKELDKNQPILLYCAHGVNSQWATQYLKQEEFQTIYHLVGGITTL